MEHGNPEFDLHTGRLNMTADDVAAKVGTTLYAKDTACRVTLGIELLTCASGAASARMAVDKAHLNSHGICHGGCIFTLADATFSFACSSHNHACVAAGGSIEFLRPAQEGDVLVCHGVERALQGRHGIYDMKIINQRGEVVAMMRGKSTRIGGPVLSDMPHENR